MSSIVPDLELPILLVDDAHWQKINTDNEEAVEYSISNRDGFQISTQGFEFIIPEDADYKEPNIIQIVLGKEQLYATAYEHDCNLFTIDKANLVPMYGSRPFKGFEKNLKLIIAIGHLAPPMDDLPRPKFTVLWAGVVNIV
ncbi:MAG: hypothetical protein FD147_713 [Chloroflexi bacterium]|nr:MAG: hypothetical protein FD147_713 [Chloroflexota bacterium]MBA4376849.1 hypothetical protein [Anaerolinea sp.]